MLYNKQKEGPDLREAQIGKMPSHKKQKEGPDLREAQIGKMPSHKKQKEGPSPPSGRGTHEVGDTFAKAVREETFAK